MKYLSIAFLALIAVACALNIEDSKTKFQQFTQKFNKQYETAEELNKRFQIFQDNLAHVEELNKREGSVIYGVTKFMDLSRDEFRSQYLMKKEVLNSPEAKHRRATATNVVELKEIPRDIPTNFDWRTKNAVTPVYNQGQCGSCWAFSATEAIESQWFLAGNKLESLSPQQIVDCDLGNGDMGCNGGDTPTAYKYVINAGGMETQTDYPYTAEDDKCAFQKSKVVAKISGWNYATKNLSETQMQAVLFAKGPLSICVDAESWQFYFGGVVSSWCGNSLDHCVMITGFEDYTTWLDEVKPIWLIRNSWGADWGEDGYIYVERGYDLCGVADEATIPVV